MIITTYLHKWKQVPKPVKQFLLRGIGILILWKFIYLYFLLPGRVIDAPLSYNVCISTSNTLNLLTGSTAYSTRTETVLTKHDGVSDYKDETQIYLHNHKIITIIDDCNGLEIFVLYAGFIICLPAKLSRKIIFIIGGVLLLHLLNILRCAALTLIYTYHPAYANFSHHYVFTTVIYAFIFWLWFIFSKKLVINEKKQ